MYYACFDRCKLHFVKYTIYNVIICNGATTAKKYIALFLQTKNIALYNIE